MGKIGGSGLKSILISIPYFTENVNNLVSFRSETVLNFFSPLFFRERHSEEYCAMYDICGARSDGKVLNCPYGSPSVKVRELDHHFFFFLVGFLTGLSRFICSTQFLHQLIIWPANTRSFTSMPSYADSRDLYLKALFLLHFAARWIAFIEDTKFVSNNHWEHLLYRSSVWHFKNTSSTSKDSEI